VQFFIPTVAQKNVFVVVAVVVVHYHTIGNFKHGFAQFKFPVQFPPVSFLVNVDVVKRIANDGQRHRLGKQTKHGGKHGNRLATTGLWVPASVPNTGQCHCCVAATARERQGSAWR
tara:strand:+ start:308 stop:655 length:348 start_codon:yes stop_codon:yes gene_type:complete